MNVYEKRRAEVPPCEPEEHSFEGMTGYCNVCGIGIQQAYKEVAQALREENEAYADAHDELGCCCPHCGGH